MTDGPKAVDARDLELLSRRLQAARWVVAGITVPVSWFAWAHLVLFLNLIGMVIVAGLLVLTNLALVSYGRRRLRPGLDPGVLVPRLEVAVAAQIGADVLALSMAFWYLGGIESPVAFLGTFHVAAVASTLGTRLALRVVAALATGIGIVVMLEFNQAIFHWHLMNDWRWGLQKEWIYLLVHGGLLLAAWLGAAFIPARGPSS